MKESKERWVVADRPTTCGGRQKVWRCANDYGASVIQSDFAYGGYELAVVRFPGPGPRYDLVYDTPITDNVIGWLDDDQCDALLDRIAAL